MNGILIIPTGIGAEIGHFALGEYIYAEGDDRLQQSSWPRTLTGTGQ